MEVSELYPVPGKRIEIRGVDLASEGAQVSPAHVVGHYE
jgi:hypothetical protein